MSLKVVAAIDSFKGSMSSLEAGQAAREGILRAVPDACVQVCPLARLKSPFRLQTKDITIVA